MPFSKPERTNLVINMTLAELFLLMLFLSWHSQPPKSGDKVSVLEAELEFIKKENKMIKNELQENEKKILDLNKRLEWWRKEFPTILEFEGTTPPGVASKEAGRGFRRCQEDNVIIHAYVIRGRVSIQWIAINPALSDWLYESGLTRPGLNTIVTDKNEILSILSGIRDFYQKVKINESECRFDYRLTYDTKEDYYDGRELFERYLYPAGISRTRVSLNNSY